MSDQEQEQGQEQEKGIEEEVADMIKGFNRSKLQALINQLKHTAASDREGRKRNKDKQHGPCITYTTVIKRYTCLICDARYTSTYNMGKGESTVTIDALGQVHILGVSGKPGEVEIPCYITKCPYCAQRIKSWHRDHLEMAFLHLLDKVPHKEKMDLTSVKKCENPC